MAKMYLLTLDYPACSFPVGLFKSAELALNYAADHPPPHADHLQTGDDDDLDNRYSNSSPQLIDHDQRTNRTPNGYTIQEFDGDAPSRWAKVQPYDDREPVLPHATTDKIDPDQSLDWN